MQSVQQQSCVLPEIISVLAEEENELKLGFQQQLLLVRQSQRLL